MPSKPRRHKHQDLKCRICDTSIEVPLCCEKDMRVEDDMIVCSLCGNQQNIPICCGKDMAVVQSN